MCARKGLLVRATLAYDVLCDETVITKRKDQRYTTMVAASIERSFKDHCDFTALVSEFFAQ